MRLSTTRTSPFSIMPREGSMVSTVALRKTTGRPDGKELLLSAGFWLILLTSLCSGCETRGMVSYFLPGCGSRVVIPTLQRANGGNGCPSYGHLSTHNILHNWQYCVKDIVEVTGLL